MTIRVNLDTSQIKTASRHGYVNLTREQGQSVRGKVTSRDENGVAYNLDKQAVRCPCGCGDTLRRAMGQHKERLLSAVAGMPEGGEKRRVQYAISRYVPPPSRGLTIRELMALQARESTAKRARRPGHTTK